MFTHFQLDNFIKNRKANEALKNALDNLCGEKSFVSAILFLNKTNEFKIDIISQISDNFFNNIPPDWANKIIEEILLMEKEELSNMFFDRNSVKLNEEYNAIKGFLNELKKYEMSLNYDFSVLNLYAKHVKAIA